MSDESSGILPGELAARLEELTRELRRQGRAAVAAQAAAESCLERLAALEEALERSGHGGARGDAAEEARGDDSDEREEEARTDEAAAWLTALMPVADAVERMSLQAEGATERARRQGGSSWWPFARKDGPLAELTMLASGLRVLRDQLAAALSSRGATIEARVGVPVDPDVHRVVEVRRQEERARDAVVLEVVRPGYAIGDRVVREADVVASQAAND